MKRTLISIAAAAASAILPFALRAQTVTAVYQIPFSFTAEGVDFSAGKYLVSSATMQSETLRSDHGQGIVFLTGPQSGKPSLAHMTFNKYGNTYFLRQVWDDRGAASSIPVSPKERQILKDETQAKAKPAEIAIIASR